MNGRHAPDRRGSSDRRRHPRGGRRPGDRAGFAPLIMVLEADARRRELTEAILAKLQFAVAPVESVQKALSIARALRPTVIVCGPADAPRVREGLVADVPVVTVAPEVAVTDALIDIVRAAIRTATIM